MRSRSPASLCAQAGELCSSSHAQPVRMVVLDSITAPFKEMETGCTSEVAERSKLLYHVASALKRLARECVRLRLALHVQR